MSLCKLLGFTVCDSTSQFGISTESTVKAISGSQGSWDLTHLWSIIVSPNSNRYRLGSFGSIGISLGKGKIAHLIGDVLYVEQIQPLMNDYWNPHQIITPNSSFKRKKKHLLVYTPKKISQGMTLEQIGPSIKKQLKLSGNLAAIEETIYQLNMGEFDLIEGKSRSGFYYAAKLRTKTKLLIPQGWR